MPHASSAALQCGNGHHFDLAKQGYVNLLPSHKKGSHDPGDSAEMIAARRRIHQAELYHPLIEGMGKQLLSVSSPATVLDVGCGEGYYSGALHDIWPTAQVDALDISKTAIRLAAKKYSAVNFAVASAFDIPVESDSVDLVLRVFAPSNDDELRRILGRAGHYLELTPAPRHLWALREALYDTPRPHLVSRTEITGFQLRQSDLIEFELELETAVLQDLLTMTPYAHRGHREKRELLQLRDNMTITMAFSSNLYQRLVD